MVCSRMVEYIRVSTVAVEMWLVKEYIELGEGGD